MDVRVWSDRHWSFWHCGAGSVGVLRLEWRGICGACRFVPRSWSASVYSSKTYDYLGALYRIMYELAVCSDGMTEAQPKSFRQNRPASEYIIWHNAHSPANSCSGCSNTCTWKRKTMASDNFNSALTGKVQVLVTLTTKHNWARMDPQV